MFQMQNHTLKEGLFS